MEYQIAEILIIDMLDHTFCKYNEKHDRELIAELRLLEYNTSTGLMTGGIHIKGALKAIGKNKGMEYEEMYRIENEKRIIIVPTAKENERLITAGISNLLEDFFLTKNCLGSYQIKT